LAIQAFGASHLRVPELRRVKRRHPASFHDTDKPVLSSDSCFIALPSQDPGSSRRWIWNRERRSAPAESQAFLSIKYWSAGAIFEYLSDCAAAFGTRKQMLITSTIIVLPLAMILIVLALVLSLVTALIARYPFAVAARFPL
jgi:hypothetical protein